MKNKTKQVKPSNKILFNPLTTTYHKVGCAVIVVLVLLLYANTFYHEYALDDVIVLSQNQYTIKGFAGIKDLFTHDLFAGYYGNQDLVPGSRYRPLSLVTFAVEYQFFGLRPHISHVINVMLYALTCVLLFRLLLRLYQRSSTSSLSYLSLPLLAALLFAAHPLHTEVVANIKGRDEILGLLGSLGTLYCVLRYLDTKVVTYWFYSLFGFFLALLSKENAITFLAVIPLTIYFFTKHERKSVLYAMLPLAIAAFVYMNIRLSFGSGLHKQITDIMNDPFFGLTFLQKYATIVSTFGIYLKLLLFPHPLTYDYYPYHVQVVNWFNWQAWLPLFLYAGLIAVAIKGFKQKSIISYGILFYLITFSIVSNVLFNIGAFMNERFMFISSIGFCMILAYLLVDKLGLYMKIKPALWAVPIVILLLYSFKTIDRNVDWKDDRTLTLRDVETSSNSAKSNASAGYIYMMDAEKITDPALRKQTFDKAIKHFKKALDIYPEFVNTMINLGAAYYKYNGDYKMTVFYYLKALQVNPSYSNVYQSIFKLLPMSSNTAEGLDYKISVLEQMAKIYPDHSDICSALAELYTMKNDKAKADYYTTRAQSLASGKLVF